MADGLDVWAGRACCTLLDTVRTADVLTDAAGRLVWTAVTLLIFLDGAADTFPAETLPDETLPAVPDDAALLPARFPCTDAALPTLPVLPMPPREDTLLVNTLSEPVLLRGPCHLFSFTTTMPPGMCGPHPPYHPQ